MGNDMGTWSRAMLAACLLWAGVMLAACSEAPPPPASASVRLLDTWPTGTTVVLGRNESFYLHLAYDAPEPTHLWAEPMFHGKPAHVGSNPSTVHVGSGEAVVWFFLMDPAAQVDEVRIQTGSGGPGAQPTVTVWRGSVRGSNTLADLHYPDWLNRLMPGLPTGLPPAGPPPAPPRGSLLESLAIALFWFPAFLPPLLACFFLRGNWRWAMGLPLLATGVATLRFVVDTVRDTTSHNLWPFEVLMYTAGSFIYVLVVLLAWAVDQTRRKSR